MKVVDVETLVIQLPGRRGYGWRSLKHPIGRYVLLKITTDGGIVGVGEAPALLSWGGENGRYYGEDPAIVMYLIDECIAPMLTKADACDIRTTLAKLDESIRGYPYTKAMLECALLDAWGKTLNIPVYELLGGAVRRTVPVCHSIGLGPPNEAADEAVQVVEDGIRWLQVKVSGEPRDDLRTLRAVREAVGDEINIYPDVNRGYKSAKAAISVIGEMERQANIVAVEQPVEGARLMAEISAAANVPVMADESCWTPQDAVEVVQRHTADFISIYYTKPGGLSRAAQIGTIACAAGVPVNVNGSLEGGVGNAANLHLAAVLEGDMWPAVIAVTTLIGREQTRRGGVFYTDDVIAEPFVYKDGSLVIPKGPGLGVELDDDKVRKYQAG